MKVGKHTLLIDGNYFVFSRLFVLPKPKTGKLLGDDKQKKQFMRKLSIDFASEMRKLKGFVDDVIIFNEITPKKLIEQIIPNVLVKGGDYKKEEIVGYNNVTKNGGVVRIVPLTPGFSTTLIINKSNR